jgi:DNA-binding transcriptional regulator WhiA
MLVASEVKGELARIHPARACCRRAELIGLLYGGHGNVISTLDHSTARIAVALASSLAIPVDAPRPSTPLHSLRGRHHLRVAIDPSFAGGWEWADAPACDRRAFLRGALLGCASLSLTGRGAHIEFVLASHARGVALRHRLAEVGVHGSQVERRGRQVVYLKGQEEIAALLRLTGANRGLLDFEPARVGRDEHNRHNRLLNAERANVDPTVRAADRQLQAIAQLETSGTLPRLPDALREVARRRRLQPDADLDDLAAGLGISRSAVNHRLRRLLQIARDEAA